MNASYHFGNNWDIFSNLFLSKLTIIISAQISRLFRFFHIKSLKTHTVKVFTSYTLKKINKRLDKIQKHFDSLDLETITKGDLKPAYRWMVWCKRDINEIYYILKRVDFLGNQEIKTTISHTFSQVNKLECQLFNIIFDQPVEQTDPELLKSLDHLTNQTLLTHVAKI